MSTPEQPDDDTAAAAEQSAFARETPPHVDPDDPEPGVDPAALDTAELGEGGPAGA